MTSQANRTETSADTDILLALQATVGGSVDFTWTGDDGLFARAAREIERLRAEVAAGNKLAASVDEALNMGDGSYRP